MNKVSRRWVVVYRTGGYARFSWHRTESVASREEAIALRDSLRTAGHHALEPQDAARSLSLGLPETFFAGPFYTEDHPFAQVQR